MDQFFWKDYAEKWKQVLPVNCPACNHDLRTKIEVDCSCDFRLRANIRKEIKFNDQSIEDQNAILEGFCNDKCKRLMVLA